MIVRGVLALLLLAAVVPAPPVKRPSRQNGPHANVSIPLGSGNYATSSFKVAVALLASSLPVMLSSGRILRRGTHFKTELGRRDHIAQIIGQLLKMCPKTVKLHVKQFKARGVRDADKESGIQNFLPAPRQHGRPVIAGRDLEPSLYDFIRSCIGQARAAGTTLSIEKLRAKVQEATAGLAAPAIFFYHNFRRTLLRMGFKFGRIKRKIKARRDNFVDWLLKYAAGRVRAATQPDDTTVHLHLDEFSVWRDEGGNFSWYCPEDGNIWPLNVGNLAHTRWTIAHTLCAGAFICSSYTYAPKWWKFDDGPGLALGSFKMEPKARPGPSSNFRHESPAAAFSENLGQRGIGKFSDVI